MRTDTKNQQEITVNGKTLEQVQKFQYLGSIFSENEGRKEI